MTRALAHFIFLTVATTMPVFGAPAVERVSASAELESAGDAVTGFQQRFRFPEDARSTALFGIDVSHHQGEIDWSKVSDQSVMFAYVKATQGSTHLDTQFVSHWETLAEQGNIFRGAYHFMSATADPAEQARNFLDTIGDAAPGDLPPCLDLEWDYRRTGGRRVDRWSRYTPDEVAERALVWLKAVEEKTGKKPIIYTSSRWWQERLKDSKALAGYRLWIADYDGEALRTEAPWVPEGFEWVFWQITDRGRLTTGGVHGRVDANYYRGTHADFIREFGLDEGIIR
jgi:lysozyme